MWYLKCVFLLCSLFCFWCQAFSVTIVAVCACIVYRGFDNWVCFFPRVCCQALCFLVCTFPWSGISVFCTSWWCWNGFGSFPHDFEVASASGTVLLALFVLVCIFILICSWCFLDATWAWQLDLIHLWKRCPILSRVRTGLTFSTTCHGLAQHFMCLRRLCRRGHSKARCQDEIVVFHCPNWKLIPCGISLSVGRLGYCTSIVFRIISRSNAAGVTEDVVDPLQKVGLSQHCHVVLGCPKLKMHR